MKILVLGSLGSMGSRYSTILRWLGHEVIGYDIDEASEPIPPIDGAIIATPTENHIADINRIQRSFILEQGRCPILCEKPLTTEDLTITGNVTQVNNWEYLPGISPLGENNISYKYFRAGQANDRWDLMQPLWLSRNGSFNLDLLDPVFNITINGTVITQRDIDQSYVDMIRDWLAGNGGMDLNTSREMITWIRNLSF